ncbi:MAG: DUF4013 domain-containing protein [Methanobrevibacter sp.]|uniref:DUF4013 domain-containing protein n=1 Tax=Methanobrevibacter sp. TaxID=66852 RepID=UPI0025E8F580|nr:DUF4013 domain-containing protein [Methanobrevibacter sp.]MBR0272245.1 DUF4013 domain-containing protein [Methanobrevibacter sp.]
MVKDIIKESFFKPFREYKTFIFVIALAVLCKIISDELYSLHIGKWSLPIMGATSLVILMIVGIMLSHVNRVVNKTEVEYFNVKENIMEGFKEYIINLYYMILSFLLSLLFTIPTGVYTKIIHIHDYFLSNDMNTAFLTLHELSESIPINLQLDLAHSLQINLIIGMLIAMTLISFGFIGRIILLKTDSMKKALNLRNVFEVVKEIGYIRYIKFILAGSAIIIVMFNILISLKFFLSDIMISSIFEAFVLIFATNSFYMIVSQRNS